MVALKEAEQDEGVLAFTYQLIDYRVRCHHSASATNEIPAILFVAPSRLGSGDDHVIGSGGSQSMFLVLITSSSAS